MKLFAGVGAAIAIAASIGVATAATQAGSQEPAGGVVRKVDRVRPAGVSLVKGKQGKAGIPVARRVAVVSPPTAALAPTPINVAEVERCGCPVAANMPSSNVALDRDARLVVDRLCAEITRASRDATTEDLEATIVFALDQSGATKDVRLRALEMFAANDCAPRNLLAALAGARSGLLRDGTRGTAALAGAGFPAGDSAFSAPQLAVGGGSANYTL